MGLVAEIKHFECEKNDLMNQQTLHILNGQTLLQVVEENQLLLSSKIVSFNEAMCANPTIDPIFTEKFNALRAKGHVSTINDYQSIVIEPLRPLFEAEFTSIVLWFGEDVFCQMNALTLLAYMEQVQIKSDIYLVSFDEVTYEKLRLESLKLGVYRETYRTVLCEKEQTTKITYPILDQAMERYLSLQEEENPLTNWINQNESMAEALLIRTLMAQFPEYGYGDVQYQAIIQEVKNKRM